MDQLFKLSETLVNTQKSAASVLFCWTEHLRNQLHEYHVFICRAVAGYRELKVNLVTRFFTEIEQKAGIRLACSLFSL